MPVRPLAVLAAILLLAPAAAAEAQQGTEPPLRVAASSLASVEVHLNSRRIGDGWYEEDASLSGPSRIAITYGQPHARGRRVEGGLVPRDTVWRLGANMATTLHTDVDLAIGELRVPRGDYSLLLLNGGAGWQLVVNRATGNWGSDYDPARDLGRIPMAARALGDRRDALSIFLVPESGAPARGYAELRGTLRIEWGNTELTAPWRIER